MAKSTTREQRAESRARRRSKSAQEPPELDETLDRDGAPSPADALRTAASAAIAGAAVGAAQALARRRRAEPEEEREEEDVEPETSPDEPGSQSEPGSGASDADDGEQEQEEEEEQEEEQEPAQPIAAGDARGIVDRAREQLRELHGADAETVSSIRRTADGWHVGLEVVELHRIPDSTDVLATYEVTLDGDGNLLTFERRRRYYRSEAERA
jgi:hypothetical protein